MMVGREITNQYHREFCTEVGEEVLRIDNLSSYRFKDVSLKVHRGEVVGISGLVGAGRTELIKAIFGFDRFERGEVTLFGKKYKRLNTRMATRLKVGLVPEDRKEEGVIVEMPIRQNISTHRFQLFKNGILNRKRRRNG